VIARSSSGRNFDALVHYLLHGTSGQEHDRVAWVIPRNLALDDPELVPQLMRATAAQNHRVKQPSYHLILAFDPSDQPTPALMYKVAQRVLADLGLSEHQALLVAHRDHAHAHVHIAVNRVHPETGRAWDRWHDHMKVSRHIGREVALGGDRSSY
jgi:Relaxase/Mobilisation nuclease domain